MTQMLRDLVEQELGQPVDPKVSAMAEAIAARHGEGVTAAQVALAWVLSRGRHVVPVPGAKQERWVAENAAAAGLRLTPQDLAEVAKLPAALGSWE